MKTNIRNIVYVIGLAILAMATKVKAQSAWQLAYENNSTGGTVNGSVANLVKAIEAGAAVKILTWEPPALRYRVAVPITVTVSPDRKVVSANYRELACDERADGSFQIKSAVYDIDVYVNSTGFVSYARYYKNGSKLSDSTYSWCVKWFVKY